jgi:hypothetical protein
LTSFTKVVGFAAVSGCYFTSGTYLYSANKEHDYGTDRFETCDTSGMHALKTLIYIAPLYIRFMQNMRQQYDSIQRRKEAEAVALKVAPLGKVSHEVVGKEDKQIAKGEDEDEDISDVKDPELEKIENISTSSIADETCSPRAGKGVAHVMSHSESQSELRNARPTSDEDKGRYTYLGRVKKFVFSYLLIWPYSYNALKYFLSIMVVVFGAYPPQDPESVSYQVCYLSLACISTMYSTYWDFRNDWGLFQMKAPKPLLREKIYYGNTEYFYYIVIFLNPIFRSFWTLSFTPYGHHPFLACFEIFRRSLWACMRMELGYINELKKRSQGH